MEQCNGNIQSKKIGLGILGTAEIAYRRFLPALMKCEAFQYVGVASREIARTEPFVQTYGGKGYAGYESLLADEAVNAVYIPLPPALHFKWAKKALEHGKHVLLEKPFTTSQKDTEQLVSLAGMQGLAVHENYMFLYHSQLDEIKDIITSGELGEVRLYRMAFGFPKRAADDFRYRKELGGGALLDCGGYPVRLALGFLGGDAYATQACLCQPAGYEVDLYGSAVLENSRGVCAQIAFGMDNSYKCELEVWGSVGTLRAPRIFTAPADFAPEVAFQQVGEKRTLRLAPDDSFLHSLEAFADKISSKQNTGTTIVQQAALISAIRRLSGVW